MKIILLVIAMTALVSVSAFAQTTEFTYQGSLSDSGSAANGSYDFEFALFDALANGSQIGGTLSRNAVSVSGGVFSVALDFGNQFPGANRYLEIRVRPAGQSGITVLDPRQLLSSTPYSVRSLNATTAEDALTLGGVAASQYVLTSDSRLSDARNPLPGSASYIQNQAAAPQTAAFNINGSGTVAKLGIGVTPSFGLDVYAEIVAYWGLAFRDTAHRWALRSTENGLETKQVYNRANGLVNMTRVIISDSGNLGVGTTAPSARLDSRSDTTNAGYFESISGKGIYVRSTSNYGIHATSSQTDAGYFEGSTHFTRWITLDELSSAGSTSVCRNASNRLSTCSSSLRYKNNVGSFNEGLALVEKLRPITFDWKDSGMHDLGLAAEEVEKVEPLLVTYNDAGQVEGVKYDRMSAVLVNALQEQEAEIQSQRRLIDQQDTEIHQLLAAVDDLRQAVCSLNPQSTACVRQ